MKALLKSGTVVSVHILNRKTRGWFFPKEYFLVQYEQRYVTETGRIDYTKLKAEWVLAGNVFED